MLLSNVPLSAPILWRYRPHPDIILY